MITFIKVIWESINQAVSSLWANKLRSFLSLLGITIGIFCIISIKSAVDSLQQNVMEGLSELGSETVYVEKYPWNDGDWESNYFKYMKRPDPDLEDYEMIKKKSRLAAKVAFSIFTGGKTIKYKSNSLDNAFIKGSSYDFQEIQKLEFVQGRHFTLSEYNSGTNKVVLGSACVKELFPNIDPIGKEIKLAGQNYKVIGVLKEEGDNDFNFMNFDDVIWISLTNARRFINIKGNNVGQSLVVKGVPDVDNEELKAELTGILRSHRGLKPREEDNFSLMEVSALNAVLEGVFGTLNLVGVVIGMFALIVGMFSVANIMFVSVKERTNIIGIKKAIGAQKGIILLEFLVEAIFLCIIGGLMGLLFSYIMIIVISNVADFEMVMTFRNAMWGIIISIAVGIISGIIPAYLAARMDPVVAIRQ